MIGYNTDIEETTIYIWRKAQSGKIEVLRLDPTVGDSKKDAEAWEKLNDSFLDIIGSGDVHKELTRLRVELALIQCDIAMTGSRVLINKINRLKSEIEIIIKRAEDNGEDVLTTLIHLSKWMGFKVDQRDTMVTELYKMLDLLKAESDEIKRLKAQK